MPNFRFPGLMFSGLIFACTAAPVQEMSDARQAIESAVAVGADARTSSTMHEAESLMEHAQQAMASRKYRAARRMALDARLKAISARTVVQQDSLLPESILIE